MCRCSWVLIARVDNKGLFLGCRSRWSGAASERLCFTRSRRIWPLPPPPPPPTPPGPAACSARESGRGYHFFPPKGSSSFAPTFTPRFRLFRVSGSCVTRSRRDAAEVLFRLGLTQSPLAACISITAVWRTEVSVGPLPPNPLGSIECPSVSPCFHCVIYLFFLVRWGISLPTSPKPN